MHAGVGNKQGGVLPCMCASCCRRPAASDAAGLDVRSSSFLWLSQHMHRTTCTAWHPAQAQATAVVEAAPSVCILSVLSDFDVQWLPRLTGLSSLSLDFDWDPAESEGAC